MTLSLWDKCLGLLQKEIGTIHINTWLKPLSAQSTNKNLVLFAPNHFIKDWVEDQYLPLIKKIASKIEDKKIEINIYVGSLSQHRNQISNQLGDKTQKSDLISNSQELKKEPLLYDLFSDEELEENNSFSQQKIKKNQKTSFLSTKKEDIPIKAQSANIKKNKNLQALSAIKPDLNIYVTEKNNDSHIDVINEKQNQSDTLVKNNSLKKNPSSSSVTKKQKILVTQQVILEPKSTSKKIQNNQYKNSAKEIKKRVIKNQYTARINQNYNFKNFVEGKSNQMALAASKDVAILPGKQYNPLFIYGSTGLGKTHLLHAIGNHILSKKPDAKIIYLHAERFMQDMVKSLQKKSIDDFKKFYRSVDALLVDDIQFFAKKIRTQEEFFHTFNVLFEEKKQLILTSDKFPKEINHIEDRLKSRFGWGLTVAIEPPELETRVAILKSKATQVKTSLSDEVAYFLAKRLRANVRELEGALNRVIANATFTGRKITIDFVKEALRDLLNTQDSFVSVENIIILVCKFYSLKEADLLSSKRQRKISRPRQLAMYLAKELTTQSLPEIAKQFNKKDHTTVLHACKNIQKFIEKKSDVYDDYKKLINKLSV